MTSWSLFRINSLSHLTHGEDTIAKGCILIHLLLATWRIFVEAKVQVLQKDVQGQIIMDLLFALTWIAILFFTRTQTKLIKKNE